MADNSVSTDRMIVVADNFDKLNLKDLQAESVLVGLPTRNVRQKDLPRRDLFTALREFHLKAISEGSFQPNTESVQIIFVPANRTNLLGQWHFSQVAPANGTTERAFKPLRERKVAEAANPGPVAGPGPPLREPVPNGQADVESERRMAAAMAKLEFERSKLAQEQASLEREKRDILLRREGRTRDSVYNRLGDKSGPALHQGEEWQPHPDHWHALDQDIYVRDGRDQPWSQRQEDIYFREGREPRVQWQEDFVSRENRESRDQRPGTSRFGERSEWGRDPGGGGYPRGGFPSQDPYARPPYREDSSSRFSQGPPMQGRRDDRAPVVFPPAFTGEVITKAKVDALDAAYNATISQEQSGSSSFGVGSSVRAHWVAGRFNQNMLFAIPNLIKSMRVLLQALDMELDERKISLVRQVLLDDYNSVKHLLSAGMQSLIERTAVHRDKNWWRVHLAAAGADAKLQSESTIASSSMFADSQHKYMEALSKFDRRNAAKEIIPEDSSAMSPDAVHVCPVLHPPGIPRHNLRGGKQQGPNMADRTCNQCGQLGHYRAQCPFLTREEQGQSKKRKQETPGQPIKMKATAPFPGGVKKQESSPEGEGDE